MTRSISSKAVNSRNLVVMLLSLLSVASALIATVGGQYIISDSVRYGDPIELVFQYNNEWPTGIAVSSKGRKFSNYPPGLDPGNLNNGTNGKYTVAELTGNSTETPYPSVRINNPPGGSINYTTSRRSKRSNGKVKADRR